MFDKFGEMNSADEINELAENLLNEGDIDSLEAMAKENGIPMEYVLAYKEGEMGTAGTVSDEPRRAEKHSEKEKPVEQIAPAQTEEKHEENHSEIGEKWAKDKDEKEKPRTKTRVEYVRTLSAVDMARYISEQYAAGAFEGWKDAANRFVIISVWLSQKVDEFGKAVQDE